MVAPLPRQVCLSSCEGGLSSPVAQENVSSVVGDACLVEGAGCVAIIFAGVRCFVCFYERFTVCALRSMWGGMWGDELW